MYDLISVTNRLLDEPFFKELAPRSTPNYRRDVFKNKDGHIIEIECPGVKKKDIKIMIDRFAGYQEVNVSYVDRKSNEVKKTYYFYESDIESTTAEVEDGLLKITIPKENKRKHSSKEIDVKYKGP